MRKCNWRRLRSSRGERGCDLRSRCGRLRAKGLKINRDLNVLLVCGGDKYPIDSTGAARAGRGQHVLSLGQSGETIVAPARCCGGLHFGASDRIAKDDGHVVERSRVDVGKSARECAVN